MRGICAITSWSSFEWRHLILRWTLKRRVFICLNRFSLHIWPAQVVLALKLSSDVPLYRQNNNVMLFSSWVLIIWQQTCFRAAYSPWFPLLFWLSFRLLRTFLTCTSRPEGMWLPFLLFVVRRLLFRLPYVGEQLCLSPLLKCWNSHMTALTWIPFESHAVLE